MRDVTVVICAFPSVISSPFSKWDDGGSRPNDNNNYAEIFTEKNGSVKVRLGEGREELTLNKRGTCFHAHSLFRLKCENAYARVE